MKRFTEYLNEDFDPAIFNADGGISINDPTVVDAINSNLELATNCSYRTPYNGLEEVAKTLAYYKIFLPKGVFLDQNHGNDVFEVSQFGEKTGMNNQGEVVTANDSPLFVYFEWSLNEKGMYDTFACLCNQEDLDEILADYESEVEADEDLQEEHSVASKTKMLYRLVNAMNARKHNSEVNSFSQVNEAKMPKFHHEGPKGAVHIKKNVETGEHVVRFWKKTDDGYKRYEPADYFTDDKEDAQETAKKMVTEGVMPNLKKKFSNIEGKNKITLSNRMRKEDTEQVQEMKDAKKLLQIASRGFDLRHKYIWQPNPDFKRADKKLEQMKKITNYIRKKGLELPPEPPKPEPDRLQKRYKELQYKGD